MILTLPNPIMQPRQKTNKPKVAPSMKSRTLNAPAARTVQIRMGKPKMTQKNGVTCIKHSEYITDIVAVNSAFTLNRFQCNPGLEGTFPWLSTIASRFEYYTFKKLTFQFRPTCSTSTNGTIYMAFDYDASDPAPVNKVAMMAYDGSVRSAPWTPLDFYASKNNMRAFTTERFTRIAPVGGDVKTYDIGNFYIATGSTTVPNLLMGELYIDYEVELRTPQLGLSQLSVSPYQFGTIIPTPAQPLKVDATVFNTIDKALWWVTSVYTNPVTVLANIAVQGLQGPALINFKAPAQWGSSSVVRFADVFKTFTNVYDFWRSPGATNVLSAVGVSEYQSGNTTNTSQPLDATFVIGQRSYSSTSSREQTVFNFTFSNTSTAPSIPVLTRPISITLTPINQALNDSIAIPIRPTDIGLQPEEYAWPTLVPPVIGSFIQGTGYNFAQNFPNP
nr:MAG: hypothetical protein 2 [Sichuan sediment noda-like virus 6]